MEKIGMSLKENFMKDKFNQLHRKAGLLRDISRLKIFCPRCKDRIKNDIKRIYKEIDKIIEQGGGVIL